MSRILDRRHTAMMLSVVFFATFMDGLDGSIVTVALPDIGAGFGIDTATASWVTITYMMILAGTLVMFARIAADTGVRRVMAAGLSIFTVGSLACGLSPTFEVLIASRAVQAVGAGMMAAAGPMCCTEHLPPEKLAFGLSIVTIGASLGFAIGPAIGGIMVDYIDWNWIFLINVPLGVTVAPIILKAIPAVKRDADNPPIDYRGATVLFAAIALITFSVETLSYSAQRLLSAATGIIGIAMLALFAKLESSTEHPLLKVSLFRRFDFASIFICLMLVNMTFMGILYLFPFYGEICLGMSSTEVGIYMFISALITAVFGMPFAKWSDNAGRRWFCVASGLFLVIALVLLAVFTRDMNNIIVFTIMAVMGLSWACVGGPMASRLVEHAGDERDMASSLTNEGYYTGGTIGLALCAMLFTIFSGTDGIDIQNVSAAAFENGFAPAMAIMAVLALVVVVLSAVVKDDE